MPDQSGLAALPVLLPQFWNTEQVISSATEDEQPIDVAQSAQFDFSQATDPLQPAEGLFDQPPLAQTDSVTLMPGRPPVNRAAPVLVVLNNVRRGVQLPHSCYHPGPGGRAGW